MSDTTDYLIKAVVPFLTGSLAGTALTIFYNRLRGRIQTMECHYTDDDVISTLPVAGNEGETHNNIYSKQFILKNTTNTDHKTFVIIFEFDITAKIIRHTDSTKSGIDKLKKRLLKKNEYIATIKNFNRNDEVKFIFEIANITQDFVNVTEDECIGFKIQVKDKRKARLKSKLTIVDKAQINATQ